MFRRSRIKIIASIMTILVLLFAGTLGLIYFTSYMEVYDRDQQMLQRYCGAYSLSGDPQPRIKAPKIPDDDRLPGENGMKEKEIEDDPLFQLSIFYSVAFSQDGDVISVDDNNSNVYSAQKLTQLAERIAQKGDSQGKTEDLIYRREEGDGYILVAFMDNTIMSESVTTLFQYTLIFGSGAAVVIFFLSLVLARKIVKPLEESHGRQKQFLSDAGHELKTPVAVIRANADLLSRELGSSQWLDNIQLENNRMAALIRQLMELARTESAEPDMEKTDFSHIAVGEILPFESVAFEKGIQLSYDAIKEGVLVFGNPGQLQQLVAILLDNAVEHSPRNGRVTASLSAVRNKARFSVSNEGQPLSKEERQLIFERFYRGDPARSGKGDHYGLGLAIAKAIVTAHHGEIHVDCGDGLVTFTVSLPAGA